MEKLTLRQIKVTVEDEGLGYSIESYLSHKAIADEELAEWWEEARVLMEKIMTKLDEVPDEEEEDDE